MKFMKNKYEKWKTTFGKSIKKKIGQRQDDGMDVALSTNQVQTSKV